MLILFNNISYLICIHIYLLTCIDLWVIFRVKVEIVIRGMYLEVTVCYICRKIIVKYFNVFQIVSIYFWCAIYSVSHIY